LFEKKEGKITERKIAPFIMKKNSFLFHSIVPPWLQVKKLEPKKTLKNKQSWLVVWLLKSFCPLVPQNRTLVAPFFYIDNHTCFVQTFGPSDLCLLGD
jgi:hypothetical protein